jgi:hypothetical protein
VIADPATDAVTYFEGVLFDARAQAARVYQLAEVSRRLWSAAIAAQGDAGEPVGLDDLLEHVRRTGGEESRAELAGLLLRFADLNEPEPEPLPVEPLEAAP